MNEFELLQKQRAMEAQERAANLKEMATKARNKIILLVCVVLGLLFVSAAGCNSATTVPAGNVGVVSLFGKVQDTVLEEGLNFKNPLAKVTLFDAKQKTLKEKISMPSKDQLVTNFDISVQYRLIKNKASHMLQQTGTPEEVVEVHMIPLLRSKSREIGKSVDRAEDFYNSEVQQRIQAELLTELSKLAEQGVQIDAFLIREVDLPPVIVKAVQRKKEAAQEAEKAKEELKKFAVEQEKKEAQAEAEKRAELIDASKKAEVLIIAANAKKEEASIEAEATIIRAEAEKKAKELVIEAVGAENYVKLEALKVLPEFQNGNHYIFTDPNGTSPLPFMNLTKGGIK